MRPSATRPRATRCGRHRSARGFFALDSKPSAAHFFFSRTRRDASRALAETSAVKRSSYASRLKLKVATCLLCLLPRASRARLSESDQSTSIMKSAQPSGKPGSYEDRRETHGFLVTSLIPTRSTKDALNAHPSDAERRFFSSAAVETSGDVDRARVRDVRRRCRTRVVREDERSGERSRPTDETNTSNESL